MPRAQGCAGAVIARLVALVPRPRVNLTRYHGVFAPHSQYRALVTPAMGTGCHNAVPRHRSAWSKHSEDSGFIPLAAFHEAAGHRPSRLNFVYHERLRNCAMDKRCVLIRNVLDDQDVASVEGAGRVISNLQARDDSIQDRILKAIDAAVEQDGADTIILGCTCMAPIGPEIARRTQVPVLEPMRTGNKTAETLLSLGIRHSHQAWPKANPDSIKTVGALISGQGNFETGGDCEVCITQ